MVPTRATRSAREAPVANCQPLRVLIAMRVAICICIIEQPATSDSIVIDLDPVRDI